MELIAIYFLLFIIYSFIGYIVEVIYVSLYDKKLNLARGFLIGPLLPIYGTGSVLISLLLSKYSNNLLLVFILSLVICSVLEYFTSLIMEKIFSLRWWDYSNKKFNIAGRICLENGVLFGIGGVLVVLINPYILNIINSFNINYLIIFSIIFFILFLIDVVFSTNILFVLKLNINKLNNVDSTNKIKKEIKKYILEDSILIKRLFNAFPFIKNIKIKQRVFFRIKEKRLFKK